MERVYSIKNEEEIIKYKDATAFLIETKYSCYYQHVLDDKDIKKIIKTIHALNKKIYLRCDRILLEEEASSLIEVKDLYLESDGIFFEDFSFVTIFNEKKVNFKLVYFPFEGISSIEDAYTLLNYGIDEVILPHGKEHLLKMEQRYHNLGISCYYRNILFCSRRKLLTLKDIDKGAHLIKENTRESYQTIVETPISTIIYAEIVKIESIHQDCSMILYDYLFDEVN